MKVALIGCGHWGSNIARCLTELRALACVYDTDIQAARELADECGTLRAPSLASAYHPTIDAAVIATPDHTQYDLAYHALLSDKHVFIEKPFTGSLSYAALLTQLAASRKRTLMVGHIMAYHPLVHHLLDFPAWKYKPLFIRTIRYSTRDRHDPIMNLAPHDFWFIRQFTSDVITNLRMEKHDSDDYSVFVDFADDVYTQINVKYRAEVVKREWCIEARGICMVFDDAQPWIKKLQKRSTSPSMAVTSKPISHTVKEKEPLKEELAHFIDCIKTRKEPRTSAKRSLPVMELLEQVQQAQAKEDADES